MPNTESDGGIKFTDRELGLIRLSLPKDVDQWRLDLLPEILNEWGRTEVPEHQGRKPEPAAARTCRWRRLISVEACAKQLAEALEKLDQGERRRLIFSFASPPEQYSTHNIEQAQRELEATQQRLPRLMTAAHEAGLPFTPQRGPARSDVSYLVLLDLAVIFEWLTGQEVPRARFKRDPNEEQPPFHKYLEAVWPVVFESDDGLSSAVKNWNSHRKKYGERSPLIANLALRHPEWGIFR